MNDLLNKLAVVVSPEDAHRLIEHQIFMDRFYVGFLVVFVLGVGFLIHLMIKGD